MQAPDFAENMDRLMTPLRPGLDAVNRMDYVTGRFEPELALDLSSLTKDLQQRIRADALINLLKFWTLIQETVEESLAVYTEQHGSGRNFTWGATNQDDLITTLSQFTDGVVRAWVDYCAFPYVYRLFDDDNLSITQIETMRRYVQEFVEYAAEDIPYYVDRAANVYYDPPITRVFQAG